MRQQIPARALVFERAATMVGGVPELARRLNVAERQLDYWMRERVPCDDLHYGRR
jgi:hypothetical protein